MRIPAIAGFALILWNSAYSDLIQKWNCTEPHWDGTRIADAVSKISGASQSKPDFDDGEFVLKGANFIHVPGVSSDDLPNKALTVSARVSIAKGQRWGSIVGFLQDNGSYERGWSLGYNDSKYVFWVSTGGRLIEVQSRRPFRPGQWDDLTGVFDGREIRLYVNGALSGQAIAKGVISYPEHARYTIGAYRDDNELYPMLGRIGTISLYDSALNEATIRKSAGLPVPLEFDIRPSVQFLSRSLAKVSWAVPDNSNGQLEIGTSDKLGSILTASTSGDGQEALIPNLQPQTEYYYRISHGEGADRQSSPVYEFNTSFNFCPPIGSPEVPSKRGYAVVIGANQDTIDRFVSDTEMSIIVFETDSARRDDVRTQLYQKGLYGSRVTVQLVESYTDLPITACMADVVDYPSGSPAVSLPEIRRILVPGTGIGSDRVRSGAKANLLRPAPHHAGEWTHQYGDSGNTVTSGESLSGAASTGDLTVQWFGRPGADFGLDRGNRLPAPLAVNNRLFHQGMNRLIALNSSNGAYLWSLHIPEFQRLNMPRDASNWCADHDNLYVAFLERAWVLEAGTGRRKAALKPITTSGRRTWGYIGRDRNRLIGSATMPNSEYTEFWSKKMWFDGKANSYGTAQVCSDSLFAYDSESLKPVWHYENGMILNPTISISNHTIFFIESRHEIPRSSITSQISAPELWLDQHLVALDLKNGQKLWERPVDTEDGTITFYMQSTPETILLTASNTKYHLYTFSTRDGSSLWQHSNPWPDDHHSGHLQHPVILDGIIYLQPNGYDLRTGKIVTRKVGARSGCPTYIGADKALIYRGSGRRVAMWNRETETVSAWDRLRPSCWLSMIPANGMLLVPEGGGGCSCGGWMETSIGFAPRTLLEGAVEE